eukprot:2004068-Rhodomonas_salina.2
MSGTDLAYTPTRWMFAWYWPHTSQRISMLYPVLTSAMLLLGAGRWLRLDQSGRWNFQVNSAMCLRARYAVRGTEEQAATTRHCETAARGHGGVQREAVPAGQGSAISVHLYRDCCCFALVSQRICLRASYVMPCTDAAHTNICIRAHYAMPGTAYARPMRCPVLTSGIWIFWYQHWTSRKPYLLRMLVTIYFSPFVTSGNSLPPIVTRARYAVSASGTDTALVGTGADLRFAAARRYADSRSTT